MTFTELAILYRAMKDDPENIVKRCAYFEALQDAQLSDYYILLDKNKELEARIARLEAELEEKQEAL